MDIITHPNDLLRRKSVDLDPYDSRVRDSNYELVHNMIDCISKYNGVGLAACQIGSNINVFIYRTKNGQLVTIENPKILAKSGKYWSRNERCLSVPGVKKDIKRFKMIKIIYTNNYGDEKILKAQNMEAVIIQHELDHLNGKLIIDY